MANGLWNNVKYIPIPLLKEYCNIFIQSDIFIFCINTFTGTIGKQMVDTLVESASNVELILRYFDMFLKLKDLTTSTSFQEIDSNGDGWVTPKDFKEKMEQTKQFTP